MKAIDLFAGWGGFTLGAEQAGVEVVWAANHWNLAVEAHQMNHPNTLHVCQDLRQADWSLLPDYDLLLASPACQGHSSASQPKKRRYHDALRATAWAVVDCADATDPPIIVVENVPAFRHWRLYPAWKHALEIMGYHLEERFLTASHFGTPQRRKRLFLFATKETLDLDMVPGLEPAIGEHIEWEADVPWRKITDSSHNVQARIAKGRRNHGNSFITQHVTDHRGIGLDEPIRTITTKDQYALVYEDHYRPLTVREIARGMGFPDSYRWPEHATRKQQIRGLGNAVCPPLARRIVAEVS